MKVHYAGLIKNDMVDGQGFVVSYWAQGCPLHCQGCHNPQTWDPNGGIEIEFEDLMKEILEAISANGITRNFSILGGEPFASYNLTTTTSMVDIVRLHYPDIKIYIWTGFLYEDIVGSTASGILPKIDVLIDGAFDISQRDVTLKLRGSKNQRIIDVPQSLKENRVITL